MPQVVIHQDTKEVFKIEIPSEAFIKFAFLKDLLDLIKKHNGNKA